MATKDDKKSIYGVWQWFLAGVMVGVFLSGLIYFKWLVKNNPEQPATQNISQTTEKTTVSDNKPVETKIEETKPEIKSEMDKKPADKPHNTQFEFYDKLPKDQAVRVPSSPPPKTEQKIEETAKTTTHIPAGSLMLQAASTTDKKAGEELLAKLKEAGFTGDIQEATINGRTWFRIRVGPYISTQIPEAQQKLEEQGFEGFIAKP
ncbi:MAG: hypothetical protein RIT27_741 [Pseudomonadota bacterium]|jgi:cell division protein FtsN